MGEIPTAEHGDTRLYRVLSLDLVELLVFLNLRRHSQTKSQSVHQDLSASHAPQTKSAYSGCTNIVMNSSAITG
jgi:hypothetical protein